MALATRSAPRPSANRRAGGGRSVARTTSARRQVDGRGMVKRTAPLPGSTVVPLAAVPRRRRTARLVTAVSVLVVGLMLGAAAFQTQIARRQVTLDQLDNDLRAGRDRYELLRQERAELRSPGRLVEEATALGMEPATQTEFVSISADDMAAVQRAGAVEALRSQSAVEAQFQQYAEFKAQAQEIP